MKNREFEIIGKNLLPHLPGFVVRGPMVFMHPIGDMLKGLYFDSSSHNRKGFYVEVFVLPLFVPTDMVYFNYGKRLSGAGAQWNARDPNLMNELVKSIQKDAIPFFDNVSTIQGVVEYVRPMAVPNAIGNVNLHSHEALAYTLIKANNIKDAFTVLNQIQETSSKSPAEWELEIKVRARLLQEKLLQSPEAAFEQLETWKAETIRKLGLEKYYHSHPTGNA
jgi:hypothetical protein